MTMATVSNTNTNNGIPTALLEGSTAVSKNATSETSDRFLKLLVTQMKNQDPLNPVDNAEVTSQMAQISTVTGIEKLNSSMDALGASFSSLQMMQGASLVGRQVLTEGNALHFSNGTGKGGFDLAENASSVQVEIRNATGKLIDQIDLGSKTSGNHQFEWTSSSSESTNGYTFKVNASSGSKPLTATTLSTGIVDSVSTKNGSLNLRLGNGSEVAYTDIKAFS
jgi:flagellar basal-body rod modification protein FlgD